MPLRSSRYDGTYNTTTAGITLDVSRMPDIADLISRLHFHPAEGRIWLDDQRMLLLHASALAALRHELIETVGADIARRLLTRLGYHAGTKDAEIARKLRQSNSIADMFAVGPQLHALEGIVQVEPVRLEIDIEQGKYYGEFIWNNSSEDEFSLQYREADVDAACWMQIGYASGYTSAFVGRPILYQEVECRALGQKQCRIVGKPLDEWPDAERQWFDLVDTFSVGKYSPPKASDRLARYLEHNRQTDESRQVIGISAGFNVAWRLLQRVAPTQTTVLLSGESGVGKEVFARALHQHSRRADAPFIAVNCAAIPEHLVEAELFGVEKGAYTGAQQTRPGRFERAHRGTLFLDEIGILGLAAQSKILRAIQEGEIERLGDNQTRRVDVRVVAATNVDLKTEVSEGRFREDLYFRLNVFPIAIPPLRERRADIPLLMHHFLCKFIRRDARQLSGFTAAAIDAMLSYHWPGNIRELENRIERGSILASDRGPVDLPHLFSHGEQTALHSMFSLDKYGQLVAGDTAAQAVQEPAALLQQVSGLLQGETSGNDGFSLDAFEQALLRSAVRRTAGNLAAAARLLGITRPQLAYRLAKYGAGTGVAYRCGRWPSGKRLP